jgi:nucleotide-binding universal stress UspA family protein
MFAGTVLANAQAIETKAEQDKYTQVITERANKIVTKVGITDSVKFKKVRDIIVEQYRNLNAIDNERDTKVKDIKQQSGDDKAGANIKIAAVDTDIAHRVSKLHQKYLSKLGRELNTSQVDEVKNGMTYNIYPLTYAAYNDELPSLTEPQKAQIKAWLIEAREYAIDAGTSEKKHAWFGKYKGRINNYLSAQGYDMKKAGEEWQQRIKDKKATNG